MSESPHISIDQRMLLDRLYECLAKCDRTTSEGIELSKLLHDIIDLVVNAPSDATKKNFPRIGVGVR
jgi:hypothetical protein